jgi:L-amino acid N-acyltransferase YncA
MKSEEERESTVLDIRRASQSDARAIAEVHVASWRETYRGIVPDAFLDALSVAERERMWARGLAAPDRPSFVFVATDAAGRVVGFAGGGPRRDGDPAYAGELYAIYLLREAQGQSAGRRLTAAVARELAAREMRSMLVWVFEQNPARRFYEALGGTLLGQQQFELGGQMMTEVSYGWLDTTPLYEGGGDGDDNDRDRDGD